MTGLLPAWLRRRLRPRLAPLLYRAERGRLRRLYSEFVTPGTVVFDVGAAEGYHAEVFLDLGARVVCLEPQPEFAATLERRLGENPGLTLLVVGAAGRAGVLPLAQSSADPEISTFAVEKWSRGRYQGRSWDNVLDVPMVALDDLIAEHGVPDFIKIDVEGFEADVLAGLSVMPRGLSFEFTREFLDDASACLARLTQLGATEFNYTRGRRHQLELSTWTGADELVAGLRSATDARLGGDIFARSEAG